MQIPILSGIYSDEAGDFRTSLPRNLLAVPKAQGISSGYLRPADGIKSFGTAVGPDRGGIRWSDVLYRVSGSKLVKVAADGSVEQIGDVGDDGQASLDYSFDHLGIASEGKLWLYDGEDLKPVTDPDIGTVIDAMFIAGYWMTTDGTNLVVTELNDPFSVNPLKYGSAESDPDPVVALGKLRSEAIAFGRYTIENFQNVGGSNFPFQVVPGAQIPRGVIGTHAVCEFANTFAFVGSGRGEPPAVYAMASGDTVKLSTREIDQILLTYSETDLAQCVVESKTGKAHEFLYVHLPDRCLVYDAAASKVLQEPVWVTLDSGVVKPETYRARNLVWVYDQWIAGDPTSSSLGTIVDDIGSHYGETVGWEFGTVVAYNGGNGAIVHEMELVCLSGRVAPGADPVIWTSYSIDGETWSQERSTRAGRRGQRVQRIAWRMQGTMQHWRIQRFRGTSDSHLSIARLEAQLESLNTRPG